MYSNTISIQISMKRVRKLPTFGGAIAAALCVDRYSRYAFGKLLTSTVDSISFVSSFVDSVRQLYRVPHVACDSGVMSQSNLSSYDTSRRTIFLTNKKYNSKTIGTRATSEWNTTG